MKHVFDLQLTNTLILCRLLHVCFCFFAKIIVVRMVYADKFRDH